MSNNNFCPADDFDYQPDSDLDSDNESLDMICKKELVRLYRDQFIKVQDLLATSDDEVESDLEEINETELVELFRDQAKPIEVLPIHYCVHSTKAALTNLLNYILSLWRAKISRTNFIIFGMFNLLEISHV